MIRRVIVLSACLCLWAAYVAHAMQPEQVPLRQPLARLSKQIGPWTGRDEPQLGSDIVAILGVDEYINRDYYDRSGRIPSSVALYVGYYKSQREGDTIHSPLNCIPGSGWEPVRSVRAPIDVPGVAEPIVVNRLVIQKGADKQVVAYWYQAHGRIVASEYWSKLFMVYDAVRLNRSDAALVRVISPILPSEDNESGAERRVTQFVQTLFPTLNAYLPS
jgi:EpsI family protein